MTHSQSCRHYVEPVKKTARKKKTKDSEETPEPKDDDDVEL